MEYLTPILSAVGGAIAVLAPVGIAWLRRRSSTEIAATIHDEKVTPHLLGRIRDLEQRDDEHATRIEELGAAVAECGRDREKSERHHQECLGKLTEAHEAIDELRGFIERRDEDLTKKIRVVARETLASTPPGSWALESEPERED